MSKPTYIKTEKTATEFQIIMPSGTYLNINLYHGTPKEDIEFVERLVKMACDAAKDSQEKKP